MTPPQQPRLIPPPPQPSWPSQSDAARRNAEQQAARDRERLMEHIRKNEAERGRR